MKTFFSLTYSKPLKTLSRVTSINGSFLAYCSIEIPGFGLFIFDKMEQEYGVITFF